MKLGSNPIEPRLLDLLCDRATVGLPDHEASEMRDLLVAAGEVDVETMDHAAAALAMVFSTVDEIESEALPDSLRMSIIEQFEAPPGTRLRSSASIAGVSTIAVAEEARGATAPTATASDVVGRIGFAGSAGWLAAAACLIVALIGWLRPVESGVGTALNPPAENLLSYEDTGRWDWTWQDTLDQTGAQASGEVIWNNRLQRGEMVFTGLASLDPEQNQYQLWIFDPQQNNPIDGGVFDVPAGVDHVRIPIDAKLNVSSPTLFAITVEKPGGVVVSDRSRIALVADPQSG